MYYDVKKDKNDNKMMIYVRKMDPFKCDKDGNSEFSIAIMLDYANLAQQYIATKLNADKNKHQDLVPLLTMSRLNFYIFICENVCNKYSTSTLNEFLNLKPNDIGAKRLFAEARESYESYGLDGSYLLNYYNINTKNK